MSAWGHSVVLPVDVSRLPKARCAHLQSVPCGWRLGPAFTTLPGTARHVQTTRATVTPNTKAPQREGSVTTELLCVLS